MRNWKHWLTIAVMVLGGLAVVALAVGISLTNFLVDMWWFSSLEYDGYFWLRVLYRYILSGSVTIFFFIIFFIHFWAASRYLGVDESALSALAKSGTERQSRNLLALFQTGSMQVYTPLSLILAIMIAVPFYTQWEQALLFFFGPETGVVDPVYGKDISFYLLRLPILKLVQTEMLSTSAILLVAVAFLYWLEHQLIASARRDWPIGARLHICFLVVVTALIMAWGFILQRDMLLYNATHEPVYYGPGFVEMRYVDPFILATVAALTVVTGCVLVWVYRGKAPRSTVAFVILFIAAVGLRYSTYIPKMLDRFLVKPNPVAVERDFMSNNIKATLAAFGLDKIKTIELTAKGVTVIDPHTRENIHNIPIWDPEYLDDVYQQLQGIRPYYNFTDVDTGRYKINNITEQVNLAAREINIEKLPTAAKNWENQHLRYTHGYGAVITPASQRADEPMEWFLRDLTLQSKVGFSVDKPDIYFGTEKLEYAVVPNRLQIPDISSFDVDSSQNYTGHDGMPISSLFRRLLFALHLRDEKLFFSINIDDKSKLLIRRNIVERIKTLTPFLALDNDPYIVVTERHIYWVQDAYTMSSWYPASKPTRFTFARLGKPESDEFNYIRNSVKIVVDAFDGTVDYYVSDPTDPIILGFQKAYPGVFKDIVSLPPLLREQLRYPRDIFAVQMGIYAKYHQTDPALFYQQAETWDFAKVDNTPMKPYYFTTYLEGAEEMQDFILLNAMTPVGRTNLSMIGVGGSLKDSMSGKPFSPKLVVYEFSREVQVDGPSQVSALIDQDPEIARLFSLWDQKGSHVKRGRMIVLPIGRSLLYVQPIYLVSTASTKIPELARVILSMGNIVIMDTSLEKALDRLEARMKQAAPTTNHAAPPENDEAVPSSNMGPM